MNKKKKKKKKKKMKWGYRDHFKINKLKTTILIKQQGRGPWGGVVIKDR
ncbi:hypothetical protein O5282_06830 [Escherichia coli]|nr:hypothetical protein [Escherichia coli]